MAWFNKYPKWNLMTEEQKKEFMKESVEENHKSQYYASLKIFDFDGPKWEDLTEEQREHVREENRRYQREMNDLGNIISKMT